MCARSAHSHTRFITSFSRAVVIMVARCAYNSNVDAFPHFDVKSYLSSEIGEPEIALRTLKQRSYGGFASGQQQPAVAGQHGGYLLQIRAIAKVS